MTLTTKRLKDVPKNISIKCSFCGKGPREVRHIIAGHSVFICNECVKTCTDIIKDCEEKIKKHSG